MRSLPSIPEISHETGHDIVILPAFSVIDASLINMRKTTVSSPSSRNSVLSISASVFRTVKAPRGRNGAVGGGRVQAGCVNNRQTGQLSNDEQVIIVIIIIYLPVIHLVTVKDQIRCLAS
ncbi:hypothetical protein QBC37DRAFT_395293 [Rhypophila decipiens]|uniref:Uncharacterized protein n=1 Tax=Rhypophila decipiens TaxID=261697 RepID=A0AAN7BEY9_9PEZI|nr:hypothetical protein QBC37DRAFT_395293 [Rhypophila decipiens]